MKRVILRAWLMNLLLVMLLSLTALGQEAQSVEISTTPYHVMMVIDKTGSMRGTDPEKMVLSAAKQFVTQLCDTNSGSAAVTSVGVMAFALETEEVAPLTVLDSQAKVDEICQKIDGIEYLESGTGGTDPYVAVYDAAAALKLHQGADNRNLIVLLTDGKPDRIADVNASLQKLDEAFGFCQDLDSEIYVVGVNPRGNIQEDGLNEIFRIADTAQNKEGFEEPDEKDTYAKFSQVNYKIAKDIYDVSEFYVGVFAKMFGIGGDDMELFEGVFDVPAGGVMEADVIVFSASEIRNIETIAPDGTTMTEDPAKYTVNGDANYKVVKVMTPMVGTWTVNVYTDDDSYKTYVVRMYGVDAVMSASWGKAEDYPDCTLQDKYVGFVQVTPMYKNQPYVSQEFADSVKTAQVICTNTTTGSSQTLPLTYQDTSGTFTGYFPVENGDYTLDASLVTDALQKEMSDTLTVEIIPERGSIDLGTIDVLTTKSTQVDLADQNIAEGLTITSLQGEDQGQVSAEDLASLTFQGTTIVLEGKKAGSYPVTGTAVDGEGIEYDISGSVEVKKYVPPYVYAVIAGIVVLAIALIAALLRALAKENGNFSLRIEGSSPDGTPWESLEIKLPDHPRGKKLTLWKLIDQMISILESDSRQEEKYSKTISQCKAQKKDLGKVALVLAKRKGKRLYYLKGKKELVSIAAYRKCYSAHGSNMEVEIRFTPLHADTGAGFGEAPEVPSKGSAKGGRKPSSKTFDEGWD